MSLKRKCDDAVEENNKDSKKMHWSLGLKTSMEDPNLKVEEDDKVVIIKDKYPKAKYHFLILPKENIPKLTSLTKSHVELLVHMQKKGEKLMKKYDSKLSFKLGYHAVPSMSQLHLHVISCDFDSVCLKTKRHWNSFTTDYFVPSNDVIEKLKNDGKVYQYRP
ncbi:Aprataxin [Nymphon striatum]|nr:Aprataxin [Nymphon striatum]